MFACGATKVKSTRVGFGPSSEILDFGSLVSERIVALTEILLRLGTPDSGDGHDDVSARSADLKRSTQVAYPSSGAGLHKINCLCPTAVSAFVRH